MNAVVVTGLGVVTPIGVGRAAFLAAMRAGRSGGGVIRSFDSGGFPVRIACEITDDSLPLELISQPKSLKLMSRSTRFAAIAAELARRDASLDQDAVDPARLGVACGAGGMGAVDAEFLELEMRTLRACSEAGGFTWARFCEMYQQHVNPLVPLKALPNLPATMTAILQNAQGPNVTVATACTSGTQAIGEALRVLQRGDADVMLAGGADAMINPTGLLGFHLLGALSRRNDEPAHASRPFDRRRDGFVMGEGAGMVVLEREEFARARGALPIARVLGYASTCDAYRVTDERPDGAGAARAMANALQDADQVPADIGYINAHGTGTQLNDRVESLAIRTVFGSSPPPISSTKSMIGHLLAGAGAVEFGALCIALAEGWLPPTINYGEPDSDCPLDCVPNIGRQAPVHAGISNSFGFGGQNACLVAGTA